MTDHAVAAIEEVGEGWQASCTCEKSFQAWTKHDAETRLRGHIAVEEARTALQEGKRHD